MAKLRSSWVGLLGFDPYGPKYPPTSPSYALFERGRPRLCYGGELRLRVTGRYPTRSVITTMNDDFAATVRRRLSRERGRIDKQAPFTVALGYPSPYRIGMSSLGYQQIYRLIQAEPGMACERVFLPDHAPSGLFDGIIRSYEQQRPLGDFPVVALSVAYELEMAGVMQLLHASGIPPARQDRDASHPLIIAGGPLTFSNPLPLAAMVDVIIMGEADGLAIDVLRQLNEVRDRDAALQQLASMQHVFVPRHHRGALPSIAQADDELLPARAAIITPDTELSDMYLIEAERGCSRGCTYCVMRRTTNGGMRLVEAQRLLSLIPDDAARVGLVGAAVSDHPHIVEVVNELARRGKGVGLSSLRPNRLTDAFVGALKAGGYRTLTTAMDGISDRVRAILDRRARVEHLRNAAELTRKHKLHRLKLYLMLGVPGETDEDVDEGAELVRELSRVIPLVLTVAPFCAKRNTPLDGQAFAGIKLVGKRIARLRKKLQGRSEVRAASPRWAWVEYVLAQGGEPEGRALMRAVAAGGRFADYQRAFAQREAPTTRRKLFVIRDTPTAGPRQRRWLEPLVDGALEKL